MSLISRGVSIAIIAVLLGYYFLVLEPSFWREDDIAEGEDYEFEDYTDNPSTVQLDVIRHSETLTVLKPHTTISQAKDLIFEEFGIEIERFTTIDGYTIIDFSTFNDDTENTIFALAFNEQFMWNPKYIEDSFQVEVGDNGEQVVIKTLSEAPRIFLIEDFLTSEECDEIVRLAKDNMEISMVGHTHTDAVIDKSARTSTQTWLEADELDNDLLYHVRNKAEKLLKLPLELSESLQVIHYSVDQYYYFHVDPTLKRYRADDPFHNAGGNRLLTLLFYLNEVEEGGETVFPNAINPDVPLENSCCNKTRFPDDQVLRVYPKKGSAILWYNLLEEQQLDGEVDLLTYHAGCPVRRSEKWGANFWFHNKVVNADME
eukprot:TRINITY_DN4058_c0_g1_i1.p1 TRINITY_DN4058_c0_g1~~TRINITY_DN4058_c0_g1_i1.p1  ORF type:complete len:373 (+),score=139.82 TRINITY_DN4058_c0_g1_i1:414-1532(+)